MEYRTEHDSMGEVRVPSHALWGAQTERSRLNFPIGVGQETMPYELIRALAWVKKAAALALEDRLLPAVDALIATLRRLEGENENVIKIGRTHLQDATPLRFSPPGRAAVSERSRSPQTSRARPSCRARSIRRSASR